MTLDCWLCERPLWELVYHPRRGEFKMLCKTLPPICPWSQCRVKQYERQFPLRIWEL